MTEASQYSITLCEADTGAMVDRSGHYVALDSAKLGETFDQIDSATEFATALLLDLPWCEVLIEDAIGESDRIRIVSPRYEEFAAERAEHYRWNKLPFFVRWFRKRPSFPILAQQAGDRKPNPAAS